MISVDQLNQQFGIANQITFKAGPGDLPVAEIANRYATAAVSLHGAQVIGYQPRGQVPLIWVSNFSDYRQGKAIRGGIPLCWPWFGPHPTDSSKPAHGLARITMWEVLSTGVMAEARTEIRFGLRDDDASRALWPHPFVLETVVSVGPDLRVELIARNTGDQSFTCGAALHTYFAISDIDHVSIHGLENLTYIDKVDGDQRKTQQGPITFTGETDRIYLDIDDDCLIYDPGLRRRIRVAKAGSRTTVVWNPWIDKAQHMGDFGDDEYRTMLCVETANAADDLITIPPGGEHYLVTAISTGPA